MNFPPRDMTDGRRRTRPLAIASAADRRRRGGRSSHDVDARWLMAYAAALGEDDAALLRHARADGPVAHPLFAVCYEWPAALAIRALRRSPTASRRSACTPRTTLVLAPPAARGRPS